MQSYPPNPFCEDAFTRDQATDYLIRLHLPASLLASLPSLSLLTVLFTAQNEQVPKDTTPLHVPPDQWNAAPSTPITLSSALGKMPVGVEARERIVGDHAGAFCFGTNPTFAAFLRTFGFRVSECATRCYLGRRTGEDPTVHQNGWHWGTITHIVSIVDWEGSDGRYLVDAGWGPWGQTLPIKLEHSVPSRGLNWYEAFELRHEELPLSPWMPKPVDTISGWTLYRFITPPDTPIVFPITPATPGHWSPHHHFLPISIPSLDLALFSHFSATHELAHFTAFWLVSRQLPGTGGARRSMMFAEGGGEVDGKRRAKVYTTGGEEGRGKKEGRDIEWVDMDIGTVRNYLGKEFDFRFAEV
ncbi:arylamine N-acetyltransferase 1 [Athelia psychrophila]|uniref:Arylamine N-acetyltransferase 1 n=1 Tax=Athelia psychrophila TaxID=1759441 RepID=A0A166TX42_9AGAM|nr:arylamine N-acetyltransferase 1 [Fibularhizoctonia sp. CBS 109695]